MRFASMGVAAWVALQAVTAQADSSAAAAAPATTAVGPEQAAAGEPAAGAADEPASPSGSSAMFTSGLFLTILGGAGMVGGLVYTTAGPGEYCPNCASSQYEALGYAALIGGFAAATAGCVLVVISAADDDADTTTAALQPTVSLSPGYATARWAF